ncbi:MAG: TIR domain-containing protein, partial [Aliishimia sp.]
MTKVFLSYARSDGESAAERLAKFLVSEEIKIWQDLRDIGSGESVWPQIEQALEHADHLIVIVTQTAIRSEYIHREWKAARRYGATIVPVLAEDIDRATLPRWLRRTEEIYRLDNSHRQKEFLATLYAPTKGLRSVWHDGFATKNMVSRPEKLAEVKQHLLSEDRDPVAISSVLRGRGGFGKSILASAVAQDDDIRNGYIDGVFWVTLGKEAQNVVPQLETLNLLISGKPMGTTDANTAAEELARLLDHRDVLVILDDVWTEAQLRPFLKVTRNASLLITTQQREIVEDAVQIDVEQLTGQEALAVLSRGLNPAPDERTSLQNFADEHWRWAQLLAICNHAILKRMKRGGRLEAVLTDVRQALRTGQQIGRDDRDLTLQAALDLSLSDMEPDLRDKLLLLAALDEDTEVPTDVLANLWDVELFTAQDICIELEIRSLLQPVDLTKPVAVHDNVLWFLKLRSSADETREAHKRFLDKNRPETGVWKDTQSTYMWHHVITHMRGAGLEGQADELLVDYAFLKAKLNAVGSAALYSGFLETRSIDVERVAGAVGVAVPALARNSSRLAWLLSERLRSEEAGKIQDLVTHATADMSNISGKWPILQPVGPEVLRISGHEDWVRSVAFSPDGRRIVSGAHDKTLRIWDTRSGDQLQVLRGHEDLVTSVAFSPDGSRIVSGSDDDTLRIWDARSGAQLQVLRGHEGSVTSVAFSPDGRRIVSGSRDDTLRIWDARSGDQMQVLQGHESSVYSVAFSLDGRRIVSGSNDNTLRIWDARS